MTFGHRIYKTVDELASVLRVSRIVEVEAMNGAIHTIGADDNEILGIVVNLKDYTVGATRAARSLCLTTSTLTTIQYKYLIETRISGALTMPKSALVFERAPCSWLINLQNRR